MSSNNKLEKYMFKKVPFALFILAYAYARMAIGGVFAATVIAGVYAAATGGNWLLTGLATGGIGLGVVLLLWFVVAMVMGYRARNEHWRMF